MTNRFSEHYEFRRRLVRALETDLIGPESEDELIDDAPITQYIAGILYPQSAGILDPTQDVDVADDFDEITLPDPPVAMANVRYPSSMAMTFAVDTNLASSVSIAISCGRYTQESPESSSLEVEPDSEGDRPGSGAGAPTRRRNLSLQPWRRHPVGPIPIELDVTTPVADRRIEVAPGLELFARVRTKNDAGACSVTVGLLNTNISSAFEKDADSFFQVSLELSSPSGAFVERPSGAAGGADEDLRAYRLLYRHARNFATGHGCSVQWEVAPDSPDRATRISSSFIPQFDLPLSDSNPAIEAEALSMRFLVTSSRASVVAALFRLCDGYESWVEDQRKKIGALSTDELQATAAAHLESCSEAVLRMKGGVELLNGDDAAWRAFQLANRAMLINRARSVWIAQDRPSEEPIEDGSHAWRPFQLAFILLCIRGIADGTHAERDLADLLWFPTGGGKTEAYLGLIAFTLFLRRSKDKAGGGVAILMRYTLRLLTIQQFERAALLICAAESIRRSDPDLADVAPVSLGLWVGRGGTPNTRQDARQALDKLRNGAMLEEANPVQLHSCPWCGTPLDHMNYYLSGGNKRLVIDCRNDDCEFKGGLPVYVVDEDVYDFRPTLLISTVDKFASLPWRERAGSIFNLDEPESPPELIIQDELHLISGPLGTLTGLYETAIDALCTQDGIRPKVIASTATIRRAGRQAQGLFNRTVRQFPPAGLDARDSYFAVESPPEVKASRMYVGLMAPGTSQTTLLVRTYASLLQRVQELPGSDEVKDPYWTLVGYFNSLRVLGGARMQVQDDVADRMALLAGHPDKRRLTDARIELTSREPSGSIPEHLKQMSYSLPHELTLDVILATNMISVGVDIDRLGLMAVMGQPQATSEYIQATSRVGRQLPGLIVVMFNAARSRDRSHYESFVGYHSALYRQVESTSVTPFSPRARDRGLHAVIVALARLLIPELRANKGAREVANLGPRLKEIREEILNRVEAVAPEEVEATAIQIDQLIEEWEGAAEETKNLVFSDPFHPDTALLIDAATADPDEDGRFPTLWSMRDVDAESNLYPVA